MKIYKSKAVISYLSLLVSFILLEIIFRLITDFSCLNLSLIRAILLYNMISLLFGYITSKLKGKSTYIVNLILILISTIYVLGQLGFNNYLSVYMSFKSTSQLGAVTSYFMDFMKSLKPVNFLVFIPFGLLLIFYLFIKNYTEKRRETSFKLKLRYLYTNLIITLSMVIIFIGSGLTFNILLDEKYADKTQITDNKSLLKTGSNPALCIKNFGVIPYSFIDLYTKNVSSDEELLKLSYKTETNVTDYTRHIDDTKWNILIENEKNETLNDLNKYYISKHITDKNKYTGLYENKNLIVIMMESVNDIFINEEYFPNFYKMYTNGYSFDNNYSPRNSCATGNNEFSSLTSLYPISNTCTMNIYKNNTYDESIFGLFNRKGYITNSFHNFTQGYYYRRVAHPNMGVQKFYGVEDLDIPYEIEYGQWASDEDMMEEYLDIIDSYETGKPFMSFITTVTSHMPYSSSTTYGDIYLDMTKDSGYNLTIRRYLSKLKVLDNALGILLNGLKDRGILDDTVIVLYGDHYPYGMSLETINTLVDRNLDNYENEKVPLVIYNHATKGKKLNTYTSYINLTPTLANLFNLNYDPRVYAGVDIFSKDYNNIVAFADYSWKNDKAFYNAKTGKITYNISNFMYTDDEIKKINEEIYVKINASTLSIKHNYFNYLETYIEK